MKVGIDDIKIPRYFTPPNINKYSSRLNKYLKGKSLSPILVSQDMTLVDGYIPYLIYKDTGAKLIEVYYEDEFPVIYVTGCHPKSTKEYTWFVPRTMHKKFLKKVKEGDIIKCRAKNKTVPVIVKKIFFENEKYNDVSPVISF